MGCNYWAHALEPAWCTRLEPVFHNERRHRNEKPVYQNWSSPSSPQLEKACMKQQRPSAATKKKKNKKPYQGFPGGCGKESTCKCRSCKFNPWVRKIWRSSGEGNGNPFNILARIIPWTEEPGGLQSMGSDMTEHVLAKTHTHTSCSGQLLQITNFPQSYV